MTEDDGRYDFTHGNVRDVVAAGLSAARRRQLHAAVADALVAVNGRRSGQQPSRRAICRAAGRLDEAIDALRRSARASIDLFDLDVAIGALRGGALDLVPALDGRVDAASTEREVLIDLGAALVAREGYGAAEVRDTYARAMALARMHGDLIDPAVLRGLGLAAVVSCRFDEAERLGRLLTTTIDDQIARTEGHYLLGVTAFWRGDLARSADELEASLRDYDPDRREVHQSRFAQDPYPVSLVRLALTRFWQGDEPESSDLADRAAGVASALGAPALGRLRARLCRHARCRTPRHRRARRRHLTGTRALDRSPGILRCVRAAVRRMARGADRRGPARRSTSTPR